MLTGLVFVDWQRMDEPVPMTFFPLTERELNRMEENLHAYNNETPLGIGTARTSMLLGIFSTNGDKYRKRREYIRDTYLGIDDPRICKLSEYIRQVEDNPLTAICQVPYTFIIAAGGADRPFDHDDSEPLTVETDLNGDINASLKKSQQMNGNIMQNFRDRPKCKSRVCRDFLSVDSKTKSRGTSKGTINPNDFSCFLWNIIVLTAILYNLWMVPFQISLY